MRCKKYLSALLAAVVLTGSVSVGATLAGPKVVHAVENEPIDTRKKEHPKPGDEKEKTTEEAYDMAIASNELTGWPKGPKTYGEGGIVMDAETGAILYAKNIDGKAYPASITKVLTMLIALENAKLEDTVTVTQASVDCVEYGYAHIALVPGEEITLNDALHALMLASANEAAYAIGESVGGGYEWFLNEMNERTRELGGMNSNFLNTNGMDDEEHYTCARDMALIARELLLNHPEFEQICQTLQYTIPATNKTEETRTFQQRHEMFFIDNGFEVIAGKTGYTDTARNTLVTCADNGSRKLVCVVLKTHGRNVYKDTKALLEYGFNNFQDVSIQGKEKSEDIKSIEEGAHVVLPKGVTFENLKMELVPDKENIGNAKAIYTYEGNPVGNVNVTLSESYLKANGYVTEEKEPAISNGGKKKQDIDIPVWVFGVLGIFGVLILLIVVWLCVAAHIRKKRIEERRRRRALERKRRMRMQRQQEMRQRRRMEEEQYRNRERRQRQQYQRRREYERER